MLAPWKKSYDQPRQHIKNHDFTLPTKVHLVKWRNSLVKFSCQINPPFLNCFKEWKLNHRYNPELYICNYLSWRIDAFELWCWRRLLRVLWAARRSNQSILKEISPGYSLEGLMLRLKLQYFGHLMWRVDSLEKTLMLGEIGGRRRRGRQRMRWLDCITDLMDVSLSELGSWWWTGRPGVLQFMGSQRVGHNWATDLIWSHLI